MKKFISALIAGAMIAGSAFSAFAQGAVEETLRRHVKMKASGASFTWTPDGQIGSGEYYQVGLPESGTSYCYLNDENRHYIKHLDPELFLSWDEEYFYVATKYKVNVHDNEWANDLENMWKSGCIQLGFARVDEKDDKKMYQYDVGLSSETETMLSYVRTDGYGSGFVPTDADYAGRADFNKLYIETRTPWSAFAGDDFVAEEGAKFKFCMVWSAGDGEDYAQFQIASGIAKDLGGGTSTFATVTLEKAAKSSGSAQALDAAKLVPGDLVTGMQYITGTEGNNNEGSDKIWDGSVETKFCTSIFPAESIAMLDGLYQVQGLIFATANDNAEYNGRLPNAWTISGSVDGKSWDVLAKGDASIFEEVNFSYFTYEIPNPKDTGYQYIKFSTKGSDSGCFQLSEVGVTGTRIGDGDANAQKLHNTALAPKGYANVREAANSISSKAITGYKFVSGTDGNNNEGAEKLWDGTTETKFCTGIFPISSTAKLKESSLINGVLLATANDSHDYPRLPETWTISASNDGKNWETLYTGTEKELADENFTYFAIQFDETYGPYEYVRFDTNGATSGCFQLSEVVLTAPSDNTNPADNQTTEGTVDADVSDIGETGSVSGTSDTSSTVIGALVCVALVALSGAALVVVKKKGI